MGYRVAAHTTIATIECDAPMQQDMNKAGVFTMHWMDAALLQLGGIHTTP